MIHLISRFAEKSILLVFCCTLLGAAAQVLFKTASRSLDRPTPVQLVTNLPLLGAYVLYALNTGMLTMALRKGQLSVLYPIISLTYVWVAILSVLIFNERITVLEGAGLATVVAGVAVLGLDRR